MKLSNQQIDALASEYSRRSKAKRDERRKEKMQSPEIQKLAKKYASAIEVFSEAIPKAVRDKLSYRNMTGDVDGIADLLLPTNGDSYTEEREWRHKIILASVEASTLAELEKKLKV